MKELTGNIKEISIGTRGELAYALKKQHPFKTNKNVVILVIPQFGYDSLHNVLGEEISSRKNLPCFIEACYKNQRTGNHSRIPQPPSEYIEYREFTPFYSKEVYEELVRRKELL